MKKVFFIEKRFISLIEVLIALVLTIGILTTLTFFYRQVTDIGIEVDKIATQNFNLRYIETRLSEILPKAVKQNSKKRDFVFFSVGDEGVTKPGSQSLIFTFDNQVSLDKAFSGHVLARIYLDDKGNLMVAYWPSPKRWENNEEPPIKKEMLYQGAENLSFEFYVAPQVNEKKEVSAKDAEKNDKNDKEDQKEESNKKNEDNQKVVDPEPKGSWRRQPWLEDYKQLPVMVKIILKIPNEQDPLIFIYPLANTKTHIIYE